MNAGRAEQVKAIKRWCMHADAYMAQKKGGKWCCNCIRDRHIILDAWVYRCIGNNVLETRSTYMNC